MEEPIFYLLLAACIGIFLFNMRHVWNGRIDYLPSLGWVALMGFPFLIEFPLLQHDARLLQAAGILATLVVFFLTDCIGARFTSKTQTRDTFFKHGEYLAYGLAALFVMLSGWHLLSIDTIPILSWFSNADVTTLSDIRNSFSRDSDLHPALRYVTSFSLYVIAVPAALLLLAYKRYAMAAVFLVWTAFYAIAGTAKEPLVTCMVLIIIGLGVTLPRQKGVYLLRGAIVAGFAGFILLAGLSAFNPYDGILKHLPEKYAREQAHDNTMPTALGDYSRERSPEANARIPWPVRKADYLLYRAFFTPAEVSARWYEYFTLYPVEKITLSRLIADSRSHSITHPANAVGLWAYHERFPDHYTPRVYAYASIDADAWARFGWAGFSFVLFAYAGLRIYLAWLNDYGRLTQGIFYSIFLVLPAMLAASASLQALLVAHGLILFPVILTTLVVYERFKP